MKHAMTTAASVRGTCTQVVMVVTIVTLAMPSISAGY